jgi:hypothetical protein
MISVGNSSIHLANPRFTQARRLRSSFVWRRLEAPRSIRSSLGLPNPQLNSQKLPLRRGAKSPAAFRAAVVLTAPPEDLRDSQGARELGSSARGRTHFCLWRTKAKNISSGEHEIQVAGGSAKPKSGLARLPSSRSPCEISIVQSGLKPPQKLLRLRLQLGSPNAARNRRWRKRRLGWVGR